VGPRHLVWMLLLAAALCGCQTARPAARAQVQASEPVTPPAAVLDGGDPETALQRQGLQIVGEQEVDVTQDGEAERIIIAAPSSCLSCPVRHVLVFQNERAMLDVEALSPQVSPLPGHYGLTIREPLVDASAPPCCDSDHLTHVFVWDGSRFVADRRAEALRDALTRQVDAFVASLDPTVRREVDLADLHHPSPRDLEAIQVYQPLLTAAAQAEGATLLRAYQHWWHDRLFDGIAGPVIEVPPQKLVDPSAIEDFVTWSLMRG
jgi:hypothetical protein